MRAYTPVHSVEQEQGTVQLLIKRYSEGQVSRFMHDAKEGQKIEMRGPVLIWPGGKEDLKQWDEIGMVRLIPHVLLTRQMPLYSVLILSRVMFYLALLSLTPSRFAVPTHRLQEERESRRLCQSFIRH